MIDKLIHKFMGIWWQRNSSPPMWIISIYLRYLCVSKKEIQEFQDRVDNLIAELMEETI